jgi:iron complex outermembrane receptor protein
MPAPRTPSAIGSLTVLSMSLAAIWSPAHAQSDGSGASPEARAKADKGIETVVVTAQKRSQSIKEVPVAITAVNAAQLERAGVKDIGDLAKTAASLEFGPSPRAAPATAPRSAASAPPCSRCRPKARSASWWTAYPRAPRPAA